MAAVLFDVFLPEVLVDVLLCPEPVATNAIRNAAIEFCERTRAYKADLTPITVTLATATYAFAGMPTETVVHEILEATIGDQVVDPVGPDDLRELYGADWRTKTGPTPLYVTQDDERNVRVVPIPTATLTDTLKVFAALKPTHNATGIESRIYEENKTIIAAGAKGKLLMVPKQPYTNQPLGVFYLEQFEIAASSRAIRASRGFTRAKLRSRPVFR